MALLVALLISSGGEYLFHLLPEYTGDSKTFAVSPSASELDSLRVCVALEALSVLGLEPVYFEVERKSEEVKVPWDG